MELLSQATNYTAYRYPKHSAAFTRDQHPPPTAEHTKNKLSKSQNLQKSMKTNVNRWFGHFG